MSIRKTDINCMFCSYSSRKDAVLRHMKTNHSIDNILPTFPETVLVQESTCVVISGKSCTPYCFNCHKMKTTRENNNYSRSEIELAKKQCTKHVCVFSPLKGKTTRNPDDIVPSIVSDIGVLQSVSKKQSVNLSNFLNIASLRNKLETTMDEFGNPYLEPYDEDSEESAESFTELLLNLIKAGSVAEKKASIASSKANQRAKEAEVKIYKLECEMDLLLRKTVGDATRPEEYLEKITELTTKNNELETENKRLLKQIPTQVQESLSTDVQELQEELKFAFNARDFYMEHSEKQNQVIETLQSELDSLKNSFTNACKMIQEYSHTITSLENKIDCEEEANLSE